MKNVIKTALIVATVVSSMSANATIKTNNDPGIRLYVDGLKDIVGYADSRASFFSTGFIMAQNYNLDGNVCHRGKTVGDTLDKVALYYRTHDDDLSKINDVAELNLTLVYKALDCRKA